MSGPAGLRLGADPRPAVPLDDLLTAESVVYDLARDVAAASPGSPVPTGVSPSIRPALVAALEHFAGLRVDARSDAASGDCDRLLLVARSRAAPPQAGWTLEAQIRRPTERNEITALYRRDPQPPR